MTTPEPLLQDGGTGPEDLLLVQRALRQDQVAVDQVLGRFSCVVRFVYRLNRMLGYRLATDSLEDVVQQVYMAVWPRLKDFAGTSALESWIYGFCRNCLRAEARKRSMRGRVAILADEDLELQPQGDSFAASPEEAAFRAENAEAVQDALEQLKPVEREAVRLRHLEGWNFEDIARQLDLPASTVKDRCYRALLKLKGRLKSRDPQP